ncbi:MAG: hypothetical protein HY714_05190 [Candidatus Omnitrophica bacterium]|nr:hypothetical protein [Candidatus Omnitrophota bacterium]
MGALPERKSSVGWWIGWIVLTIGSFFASCAFWTWIIAKHLGPVREGNTSILWVAAVFGSWMVLLVPLIVVMYNKVDRAYEEARIRREARAEERAREARRGAPSFRTDYLAPQSRLLSRQLRRKLNKIPRAIRGGQLVNLRLKDGRTIENVFVSGRREILGVYGMEKISFTAGDVGDLEAVDLDRLPEFQEERWLRLDGVSAWDRV